MPKIYNTSERLHLTEIDELHLESFYAYRSDKELLRYQDFKLNNRDELKAFFDEQCNLELSSVGAWKQIGITGHDGLLLGDCALKNSEVEPRITEIGITIRKAYHKKGYAKEALSSLLDLIFTKLDKHKCMAVVDVRNTASVALFESLGFRCEAKFRKHYWDSLDQDWFDESHYGMLKEDWIR